VVSLLIYGPSVAVGCVIVLLVAARWFVVPGDALRSEYLLLIALFGLMVGPLAQVVADSLSQLRPMKMDPFAYAADGSLGQRLAKGVASQIRTPGAEEVHG